MNIILQEIFQPKENYLYFPKTEKQQFHILGAKDRAMSAGS